MDCGDDLEDLLTGRKRPQGMPETWIGSPTTSSRGWRWDDPDNPGDSVRIFAAIPDDPEPWHRVPFVVDVSNGRCRDKNGNAIEDETVSEQTLRDHF
jgi:hypothetical protein